MTFNNGRLSNERSAAFPHEYKTSRRNALRAIILAWMAQFGSGRVCGAASLPSDALRQSLDALAARQNDDGSFGTAAELFGRDPAVAALCGIAFLASGSLPGRGRYSTSLEKIIDYLLSCALRTKNKATTDVFSSMSDVGRRAALDYLDSSELSSEEVDGLIVNFEEKGRKPTYGHGYATLFLSEVLGTSIRPGLRDVVESAVSLIVRTQNDAGGWRYAPKQVAAADLSVTACMLSALRAAHNAGVHVPEDTVKDAERYVVGLQNQDGGFRYMEIAGPSGYSRTAAAIHALQSAGADYSSSIERAFEYLQKVYPTTVEAEAKTEKIEYWSYGQFYAALAYWRGGIDEEKRERERLFFKRLTRDAMQRRGKDGLWSSTVSSEMETAFLLSALSVPFERTPLFLR